MAARNSTTLATGNGKRRRNARLTVRESEKAWRKFLRQPAQLTSDQVDRMSRNFLEQFEKSGVTQRMALGSLMRSGRDLERAFGRNATREAAEAGAELVANIRSLQEFLVSVGGCLDTAATRVELSMIGRADMQQILDVVRKPAATARTIN